MTGCELCGLPLEAAAVSGEAGKRYCCQGCRLVDEVLDEPVDEQPRETTEEPTWEGSTAFFELGGMHCATCEVFIERALADVDEVAVADASFATETLRIGYEGEPPETEELERRLQRWGYDIARRDDESSMVEDPDGIVPRLLIGAIFGMMTMVWYVLGLYPTYFGYESLLVDLQGLDGTFLLANIWLMTTIVMLYTGKPLLRGALVSLRARQPNMDLLVSLAAVGAYAYSSVAVLVGRTDVYFDITVMVVLVVMLGRYYEDRIRDSASDLIGELTALRVDSARLVDGDEVSVDSVETGDRLLVKSGERIPLDGTIIEGTAAIDESLLTGSAIPRERGPGDRVAGGTVVTDQPLVIEVDDGRDSALDRIVERLWHIQSARPGAQQLATKLAIIFVPLVILIASIAGVLTFGFSGDLTPAILVSLTVIIVSCPCALGLATPLAVARGVKAAATQGMILTAASVVEVAPDVETVVFDKTGTLTGGAFHLEEVVGDDSALHRAAAIEERSTHPIGSAIVDATLDEEPPTATDVTRLPRGMAGTVAGSRTIVGDRNTMLEEGMEIPSEYAEQATIASDRGQTPVFVGWDGRVRGVLFLEDRPRPAWKSVLGSLATDHEIVVLTGDDGAGAERFRDSPHVDQVFAGVPPEAKAETVNRLRASGRVAMVGDGSNDAPALATADFGIALQSGTELAADAADVVLLEEGIESIPALLTHADEMRARIRQNLGWAFLYNAVAIPIAAVGLLNPLIAAIAMASSSLLVVLNSSRRFGVEATSDRSAPALVGSGTSSGH